MRTQTATDYRQRLLTGLAESIVAVGYRTTTVADVVRRARTSRRTFYEHFESKEACFVALLTDANTEMIRRITEAVDPEAAWETQVRQAVETWIVAAEDEQAIMLSWVRDLPSLGESARALQREMMNAFVNMVETLSNTPRWHTPGGIPRPVAVMLLGGLRELMATTVEDGGRVRDITEVAVTASIAMLGPRG